MFRKLHEKIFISIQFNKAYFLYVLECENGMFQKLYKGMQANEEVKKEKNVLYGKNIHCS